MNSFIKSFQGNMPQTYIGDIQVSASVSEVHAIEAEITEHAVQGGANFSDHSRVKPSVLEIEGIVSDVKLATGYPGKTAIEAFREGAKTNPALAAWARVENYIKTSTLVVVKTSFKTYEDMALSSFVVTRERGEGTAAIRFKCRAQKMRIVTTETRKAITIPKPKDKAAKKKAANKGKKGNKKADSAQEEKSFKSLGTSLVDAVTGGS